MDLVRHEEAEEGEERSGDDDDGDQVEARAEVVGDGQAAGGEHQRKEEEVGACLVGVAAPIALVGAALLIAVVAHVHGDGGDGHDEGDQPQHVDRPAQAAGEAALHSLLMGKKMLLIS